MSQKCFLIRQRQNKTRIDSCHTSLVLSSSWRAWFTFVNTFRSTWKCSHRSRRLHSRQSQAPRWEEISCDKYRSKMTGSAAGEQIDLERNCEGGIEKMKERGRGRGRWCLALFNYHQSCIGFPPLPFKIKRQISLTPPLDPAGRITLFLQTAQEPLPFSCTPPPTSQRVLL